MSNDDRFDNMFYTVAQQAQGIEPLLDALFSFLRRKTDFYTGASKDKVESLVLGLVNKHYDIHEKDVKVKKIAAEKEEVKKREKLEKKRKVSEQIIVDNLYHSARDQASPIITFIIFFFIMIVILCLGG